jgi:hypothetical protein
VLISDMCILGPTANARTQRQQMAQMRSADRVRKCLQYGVDRTYRGHRESDATDPTTDLVSLQGAPCLPPVPDNRCLNDSSQPALLLEPIGD